jgi:hypothetical protein
MTTVEEIFLTISIIIFSSLIITILGSIWLLTSYSLKKRGYDKANCRYTLERLQNDLASIKNELNDIKTYVADLTIKAHDEMRLRKS